MSTNKYIIMNIWKSPRIVSANSDHICIFNKYISCNIIEYYKYIYNVNVHPTYISHNEY